MEAGREGEVHVEEVMDSSLPVTEAQLLTEADRELAEPPVSGEGGEQSSAGVETSGESAIPHTIDIQETLQLLENNVLCKSLASISSSDMSKENSNILSPSQESNSLTLSLTGDGSLMENSSQKN